MAWLTDPTFAVALLVAFLVMMGLWLWLRYQMAVSKARFALLTVLTLASCAAGLLTFLSGPVPLQIINAVLSGTKSVTGFDWIPTFPDAPGAAAMAFGFVSTVLATLLIYRFATTAIRSWDGPVTVNVNELAKQEKDNNLLALASVEAKRLLAGKRDPVASDAAVNWLHRQSEAPPAPAWHQFARNIFEAAFAESELSESGWRDRFHAWVGAIYIGPTMKVPLILFVFENPPSELDLKARLDVIQADGAIADKTKIYAVFRSNHDRKRTVVIGKHTIEIFSFQTIMTSGLKLTQYARDLIRRFDSETLGGTKATLLDTFVEAHVHASNSKVRVPLSSVLSSWVTDTSRRHLAITGEYGQGKSTAMLDFCVSWARRYLSGDAINERVPLLIELRGQSPAENDPVSFLAAWAVRYGLPSRQLYNLIRAGEAIVIFEGFDELRNAGRSYDRHEHFNALWRMGFPGTKLIFTGRPNFFLDEKEKNRTLRTDPNEGAAGNAFTELWELERLTKEEVNKVAKGYGAELGKSMIEAVDANPAFFEIVSRPSMLPVVATIWPSIEMLQEQGYEITSAILLERYIQATYRRKEQEIERDQQSSGAPPDANYLLLPREAREIFTLLVVWRMAGSDARNTISRNAFNTVILQTYDDVFRILQTDGVPSHVVGAMRKFEERFRDESRVDRCERISNEIASAGMFVPDPAGGPSNLRLPHKQFYEYMIAKVAWIVLIHANSLTASLYRTVDRKNVYEKLWSEGRAVRFFAELIGEDFALLKRTYMKSYFLVVSASCRIMLAFQRLRRVMQERSRVSFMDDFQNGSFADDFQKINTVIMLEKGISSFRTATLLMCSVLTTSCIIMLVIGYYTEILRVRGFISVAWLGLVTLFSATLSLDYASGMRFLRRQWRKASDSRSKSGVAFGSPAFQLCATAAMTDEPFDPLLPFDLPAVRRKKVTVDFGGGNQSSDAGLLLLREAERRLGVCRRLAEAMPDRRDPDRVRHAMLEMVMARAAAIACGHKDAVDLDRLRHDPLMKLAVGRCPQSGAALASQSTISRLENAPSKIEAARLTAALIDQFAATVKPGRQAILDIDDTFCAAHGGQQLAFWNAHHDERGFAPMHIYDAGSGTPVVTLLRPARTPKGTEVRTVIKHVTKRLRGHWRRTRIIWRGDGHYGRVEAMEWAEDNGADYIFGLAGNAALDALVAEAAANLRFHHAKSSQTKRRSYASFMYQAGSWKRPRKVVARLECSLQPIAGETGMRQEVDIRYVVTSLKGSAQHLYETVYCQRGQMENLIKLHKAQLASDRMSCHSATANQVRLVLHTAAFWLMHGVRAAIPRTSPLASAEFATIRERLIKIGARVIEHIARIRIQLPTSCPEGGLFRAIALGLMPAGP